jgi:hypothetical protein
MLRNRKPYEGEDHDVGAARAVRQPQAWHYQLVADVFAAGTALELDVVAQKLGRTVGACEAVLRSAFGQAQLATYYAATRQHLVAKRVAPLEKLAAAGEAAVDGLVAALWMATERENIREMRESAVAILAHLGMGPVKRTEQQVTHQIDTITDPVVLARIISTGELPPELEAPPSRH